MQKRQRKEGRDMRPFLRLAAAACCLGALTLGTAACGEEEQTGEGTGEATKGGTLKVLSASDADSMDPGIAYYAVSYMVTQASQRTLYQYQGSETEKPAPDLAEAEPEISPDGRTVTVKIRKGVKFSPPVNREVTAKDVKYAIERAFASSVSNPYAAAYFADIEGAPAQPAKTPPSIKGIEVPDDRTVVFKLSKKTGGLLAGALSLPVSAPVPEEFAKRHDGEKTSTYGDNVVATGPYMLKRDKDGKTTGSGLGWAPGKSITLVRNPNWDKGASGDYRNAYLDRIEFQTNANSNVAARQILSGKNLVNGDTPPAEAVKRGVQEQRDQIAITPSGGNRYLAMNTTIKPFDDPNVRKAVAAALDRNALRQVRGGPVVGDIATHFIPPEVPGFEDAGGAKGPGVDFLAKPEGDPRLAADYMRRAGYESGKYDGDAEILVVGDREPPGDKMAEIAQQTLQDLGFKLKLRLVPRETMFTKFCGSPKAEVAVCPNVAWAKDFNDPQTILDVTFSGEQIHPTNNSNWPQLDDPRVNRAIERAGEITDPEARAKAWGEIDRMITELAPAVPILWDKQPNIRSKNVNGKIWGFNASWDLTETSIAQE
jgi:peptide/nickel transport system substrate-binding protein